MYRLKPLGWWLVLAAMIVFTISGALTFARHDIVEFYQVGGYPQAQIDQIQKTGLGDELKWLMVVAMLPFLGYLLFIKKYFRSQTAI